MIHAPTRPATRCRRLCLVVLGLASAVVVAAGCNGADRRETRLPASLHRVDATADDPAVALAEREELLRDIRLHLTAITGQRTGSTHPVLVQLEDEARRIRDGVQALQTEMDMHGLQFEQSVDALLRALDHHYTVLAQIRDELVRLEITRSPTETERDDDDRAADDRDSGASDSDTSDSDTSDSAENVPDAPEDHPADNE